MLRSILFEVSLLGGSGRHSEAYKMSSMPAVIVKIVTKHASRAISNGNSKDGQQSC